MNRRDLLLNEMNIPQWVLTKPQVLKGDAQIRLDFAVKLVVVCEEEQQKTKLFQDVLRTLNLQAHEFKWLSAEQSQRLFFDHKPIFWIVQGDEQAAKIRKKFANAILWQNQNWQEMTESTHKRKLWQQMETFCQHFEENE